MIWDPLLLIIWQETNDNDNNRNTIVRCPTVKSRAIVRPEKQDTTRAAHNCNKS